ncbi:hypothetical protein EG829_33830, partial [bacterium]|nr:hypothetical protein [bacterium]
MRRLSLASAALTVVLALFTFGVGEGYAAYLHTFDCEGCHRAGTTYTTLEGNNVCLQCHGSPASSYPFNIQGGGTVPK